LYNLFVFDVPFSTLHLFTAKIKVLHRPIEVTAQSRHSWRRESNCSL
jgi:hypothetical protein